VRVHREAVAIVLVEAVLGSEPQKAQIVLSNSRHGPLGETIHNSQTVEDGGGIVGERLNRQRKEQRKGAKKQKQG
jgi:hypothetical protein